MTGRNRIVRDLVGWFDENARDLPWRREPTPWRVLVAEAMLQQTRIATVLPRYEAFLARFPDPPSMAAADEDDVLALWSGLGYYRRARSLHAAARSIVDHHGGQVPSDRPAIRALPGVGSYTAGAILSVAFRRPEPLVDGNVERFFSRLFLIRGNVKRGAAKKEIRALAADLVTRGPPDRLNQALMEMGALVCLPRNPRCPECPVAADCRARAAGVEAELPELPPKPETVNVRMAVAIVTDAAGTLLVRAPEGGFLAGTWMPPFAVAEGRKPLAPALAEAAEGRGLDLAVGRRLGGVRHQITNHRITATCFAGRLAAPPDGVDARFVCEADFPSYGLSSLAEKSLRTQFS
jgi:A/G-specific adenine glycosylase